MKKEKVYTVDKRELDLTWFSGTGGGGQHRNKHKNCARIKHIPTGIITTGQSNKHRQANLREALHSLSNNKKFRVWLNGKIHNIEKTVEDLMKEENYKVEVYKDGEWWQI
jgi:protein subunit release factor B